MKNNLCCGSAYGVRWTGKTMCSSQISHFNGEFCHFHPWDGTFHCVLSAQGARQVVEKGWGERHVLSCHGFGPQDR
eukprot:UN03972